jgi:dienelactone hydrolase
MTVESPDFLLSRRKLLKRLSVSVAACGLGLASRPTVVSAAEVDWLAEVTTPPKDVPRPDNLGRLDPLLVDSFGRAIRTLDAWKVHRKSLRATWLKFLGPMPTKRPPVELKTLRVDNELGFTRTLVRYESEAGVPVEGYLLRPAKSSTDKQQKWPALCALHATTTDSIDQIAGVKGRESRWLAPKLCRRGFIVFCPRNYLWQSVENYTEAVERFQKRHPKTLGMHKMLYDAMRGVDVLESLPDVDTTRIGTVGHSLGAKEALYLAAFDERIKVAVASEGGLGYRFTNWDAPWYLGEAIRDLKFPLNHHQLLALIAPRPFLVLAGESGRGAADGDRSWNFLNAARPVWKLYGNTIRLGVYNHRKGHDIPPHVYARMQDWLATHLTLG